MRAAMCVCAFASAESKIRTEVDRSEIITELRMAQYRLPDGEIDGETG